MALVTRSDTRNHGVGTGRRRLATPRASDWAIAQAELRLHAECRPREAGIRLAEGLLVGTSPDSGRHWVASVSAVCL